MDRSRLSECTGFEWDAGNFAKNWERHRVAFWEAEQVFFNEPLLLDKAAPGAEPRYYCLGKSDAGRLLFLIFTIRERHIRVISARDMSRKERVAYHGHEKEEDSSV